MATVNSPVLNPPDYDNIRWPASQSTGLRVPLEQAPATLDIKKLSNVNIGTQGSSNSVTLVAGQTLASELVVTNTVSSTTAGTVVFPVAFPGHMFIVYNNTSSGCTFVVKGQTGISVGSGKRAVLVCESIDIARASADV
jgi:hypothetical protein